MLAYLPLASSFLGTLLLWCLYFTYGPFLTESKQLGIALFFAAALATALPIAKFCQCLLRKRLSLGHWRHWALGLFASLALYLVISRLHPPALRHLQDEASLVSSSMMMARSGRGTVAQQTQWRGGEQAVLQEYVDKRPPLFPFFVHLFHRIAGYRPGNAFLANGFVFVSLSLFLFLLVAARYGPWLALAAPLLFAAEPAVFFVATSAEFGLFSCLLALLAVSALAHSLRKKSQETLCLGLLLLLAFSLTRYESILIAVLLAASAFALDRKLFVSTLRAQQPWLAPALLPLTPLLWLLFTLRNPIFHEVEPGESIFSLSQLLTHSAHLFRGLFLEIGSPLLRAYHAAAALCLIWLAVSARKQKSAWPRLVAPAAAASLVITLAHFFGSYLRPDAIRLFLPFLLLLSLAPLLLAGLKNIPKAGQLFVSFGALLIFSVSVKSTRFEEAFADIGSTNGFRKIEELLARKHPDSAVVVSRFPGSVGILGFSSIDFGTFAENRASVSAGAESVIVFQHLSAATGEPLPQEELPAGLPWKSEEKFPISARTVLRVLEL